MVFQKNYVMCNISCQIQLSCYSWHATHFKQPQLKFQLAQIAYLPATIFFSKKITPWHWSYLKLNTNDWNHHLEELSLHAYLESTMVVININVYQYWLLHLITRVPQNRYPVCAEQCQWTMPYRKSNSMHCRHVGVGFYCVPIMPDSRHDNF